VPKKPINPEQFEQFDQPVPASKRGSALFKPGKPVASEDDVAQTDLVGEYPLNKILPDPFQGRGGVLPAELSIAVCNGALPPDQAVAVWLQDLDERSLYWPRYQALRELADSIAEQGLINPIHIYHPPRELRLYRIESGERRYWAHWLLAHENPGRFTHVRAIVEEGYSLDRQIHENEDVSALSAVGQARNIARMYLLLLDVHPRFQQQVTPDSLHAYFRQAAYPPSELIGQKYLPDGFWERFMALTRLSRQSVEERLNLFGLPLPALELADLAGLNFSQLKEILRSENNTVRAELVELAVARNLTGARLRSLVRKHAASPDAYQREVQDLRQRTPSGRRQGTQVEVQSKRLVQAVARIEQIGDRDYRAVAQRIYTERPREAERIALALETLARAIRDQMGE
jgi:hypothetical protein